MYDIDKVSCALGVGILHCIHQLVGRRVHCFTTAADFFAERGMLGDKFSELHR